MYSLHIALCNSRFSGVSINTSVQSIIPIKLLKHRKRSVDVARTVSRLGIKTNALKYSAIARNQERNILEQLPSETWNLIAKSIVCSPSLNFIIFQFSQIHLLKIISFLFPFVGCCNKLSLSLSLRNWSKPPSHKGSYNVMELVEELQLVKICEEVAWFIIC